jgi:Zn-dependent peptidase ImmA (M78 family)
VEIEYADLGEWGMDELRSEYDPQGPTIRINKRVIEHLPANEIGEFIAFAVGHELYHHREHRGEVHRLPDRKAREIAANDFARALLEEA